MKTFWGRWLRGVLVCVLVVVAVAAMAGAALGAENPAYTGAVGSIDMERDDLGADVSCMTFNVLHYDGSTVQSYASDDYDARRGYAVSLIRAYEPDIVGMQEAANDSSHIENWPADLKADLGDGYTAVTLLDLTDQLSQMYITNGLSIWYRTSRFALLDSGAECYWSYATDCATTSKDRWFMWVKLYDQVEGKTLFVFNTHLSTDHSASVCSVCTTSAEGAAAGRGQRTCELQMLSDKVHELAQGYPSFVTGDFNCTMTGSQAYGSDTTQHQLLEMSSGEHGYLQSALMTADLQVTSQGMSAIDHVFLNTDYLRPRKLVGIAENVGGITGSDHIPYITYCDYRAAAQIGPGTYDEVARIYTDTTDARQYTFQVTPANGFTYQIYKDTGVKTGDTIWSVKDTSCYEIRFYDPSGALYSTVDVTIYATSAAKPTLSSTGLNQYYAEHAYHVVADGDQVTVTPQCTGLDQASIYMDAGCTQAVADGTIIGICGGRTTYYLRHDVYNANGTLNFSEVFPLYIYRQTAEAYGGQAVYVDKNIGDATGTVAFWDGVDVRLVQGQVDGFDALADVQPIVNTADGYSIYMAPGVYEGNGSSITKSFSLYGANWDVDPDQRVLEGVWSLTERREETVIHGQLLVSLYGNDVTTKTITVRGITFTGQTKEGSIYIIENRGGTGSSYWEANSAYMVELDIRNNIFVGWSSQSSCAAINVNCASQKSGIIACNYFGKKVGRSVSIDTMAYPNTYCRAIYGRNINGLLIDANRFVDYSKDFIYLTSQIGYGSTLPGYGVYTVQDNRFENCISTYNGICNVTSDTKADVRYLGNYFIRGGYSAALIFVDATETTGTTTNYHNCDLSVMGNKFYACERAIGFFRNGTSLNGYFNAIGLTISQNAFHDVCERAKQPMDGYSAGTAAENYTNSQQSYGHSTIYFRIANSWQGTNGVASAWDLSHNYFYSTRLAADYVNPYHPSLYINSYMKEWTNGAVSAEYGCMNSTLVDAFFPYYTNHGCTHATTETSTDVKPTSTAVSSVTGITAQGYTGAYDGQAHTITVTVPEGAFVSYSYGDTSAKGYKCYQATAPVFSQVGSYTVVYRVIAPGHTATYGEATVTITEPVQPTLTLKYPSLSFESEVLYNVYYIAENVGDVVEMGLVTFDSEVADGTVENASAVIGGFETDGSIWKVSTNGISAKDLGDVVWFRVYAKLTDGSYVYSAMKSYSAVSYANTILSRTTSTDDMKALVVAMLNYGAEAQLYFGHNTDHLMNAGLTAEQQALVSAYDESMVDPVVAVDSTKAGSVVYDGSSYVRRAPSVSFDGAFSINYYFTTANVPDGDVKLYYWTLEDYNAATTLKPSNASGKVIMTATETENQYWGQVSGIAAKELDETVFVAGFYYYGGKAYSTGVLNYSIGKYCEGIAAKDTSAQQGLAQATAVYGYYAKEYFANL